MALSIDRALAQQIVDTVRDVCGQPVNFIREDGVILASTRPERIGTLHEAGRAAARSGTVQEVTRTQGGSQPGINLPVLHNGQLVAVIGITGEPDAVRRYAHLAERITLLLVREQELSDYNRTQADKRRYALDALLNPGSGDRAYLEELLRHLGVNADTPKRLVLVQLQPGAGQTLSGLEARAEALCRNIGMVLYHYYYPDTLAAVLDDDLLPQAGRALRDFAAAQKGQCKIGIGRRVPLGELAASRQTARTACRSLTARDVHYALFDDLTWELVLADLQPDTRTALLHKTLDALEKADRALLRVYFEQDLSLQKTCAALFLHKNTLQYRLNRIEKRCGLNPRSFRDGALLYLALQAEAAAR